MKTKNNLGIPTIIAVTVAVSILVAFSATASAADINVPADYTTIQAAVTGADTDDTIHVDAGTYPEGIVTINKDLTIIGATTSSKPTINPTTDTGTANAIGLTGRGWFQIHNGAVVTFKNLIFDGTGKNIYTAVHYHGNSAGGTVENCDFMNIRHSLYLGRGINNYGQHVEVLDCTFTNIERIGVFTFNPSASTLIKDCTYAGKGDGDWLDYGIEFGGGGSGTVDGCDISACTGVAESDGSTSAGIYATDYFGPGTEVTVVNSILTGNSDGIAVGYKLEFEDATVLTAHCNDISGNIEYGISNVGTVEVDAECNWWGDDSGPNGEGPGTGDAVSSNVDFNPWLTETSSLVYTGAPQPMNAVVLEATLSDTTSTGISEVDVDFDLDDEDVGSATTNADGVASLAIGPKGVGVYEVSASCCCSLESDPALLAIYDPDGGFVTGGGWINSPEGAYTAKPTLTGKANFGFVSKYKKGQQTPTGNTEFQFKAGDLNFHSDSYDWLVIAGHKAMYKGTGTINGGGSYKFMLSAIDGDLNNGDGIDKFRIKIWEEDTNGDETIIYDNGEGTGDGETLTELGGGQIVIHKEK